MAKTSSGAVVAEYVGDDAIITIITNRFEVTPGRDVSVVYGAVKGQPEWGTYAIRGDVYGITIWVRQGSWSVYVYYVWRCFLLFLDRVRFLHFLFFPSLLPFPSSLAVPWPSTIPFIPRCPLAFHHVLHLPTILLLPPPIPRNLATPTHLLPGV